MSSPLELFKRRIAESTRPTIRVTIWLDPDAAGRLAAAEAELAELRSAAQDGKPVKMGGRIAELSARVEQLEQELLDTRAVLVLQALSTTQLAAALQGLADDDPMSTLWMRKLKAAFVRVETLDGNPVEDITTEDWHGLLDVMSAAEMRACYEKLEQAEQAALPR